MKPATIAAFGHRHCRRRCRVLSVPLTSVVVVALAALLGAGCATGPILTPPPMDTGIAPPAPLADDRKFPAPPALDGAPLTLADLLILAEYQNRELIAARQQVEVARTGLAEAFAARLPQVTITARVSGTAPTPQVIVPGIGSFPLQDSALAVGAVDVTVPIFTFGRIETAEGQARIAIAAAKVGVRLTRQATRALVIEGFFAIELADAQVAIQDEQVRVLERQDIDVNNLLGAGLATEADVLAVEARLNLARVALGRAKLAVMQARWRLLTLLGLPLDSEIALAETDRAASDAADAAVDLDAEAATRFAVEHRPETAAGMIAINQAQVAIAAAHASRLPTLSLSYDLSITDSHVQTESVTHTGSLSFWWPVFQGGAVEARVSRGRRQMEQAVTRFHATVEAIVLEVTSLYATYRLAVESVAAVEDSVTASKRNLEVLQEREREGLSTAAEVLEAHALLIESQQQVAQARIERDRTLYQYRLALGLGANANTASLFRPLSEAIGTIGP